MTNVKTLAATVFSASVIGLSIGGVAPAEAASFSFSYNFLSGQSISGTVDGDLLANSNTVTNLRNLSATYSGQPDTLLSFLGPSPFSNSFTLSGTPDFDFMGFANNPSTPINQSNFGFSFGSSDVVNGATVGTFQTAVSTISYPFGANQQEAETFSASRWSASQTTTAVPTPALLPGLIGLGFAALRKRRAKKDEAEV